jgi:hypothetical protein
MSISPFSTRPVSPAGGGSDIGRRRARLALVVAMVGIAATLLAYGVSPGVRHAVSHAAHSVRHAVDPDANRPRTQPNRPRTQPLTRPAHAPARP